MTLQDIDILENNIYEKYPDVLENLLRDHTTRVSIFWATDNYKQLGTAYEFDAQILPELITGANGNMIMPRVKKDKVLQQTRVRDMAEVFTPSWICNAQNNLIDHAWFGREHVFNTERTSADGKRTWEVNSDTVTFPAGKTWKDYIRDTRLEMACGEAPYITSRYDTTTGEFIPVKNRIGLLDRKLRVINENVNDTRFWLAAAQTAYKNTYAFEWQGDSLLLAREAMLITFIENFTLKFGKEPLLKSIKYIAYIISWNVWQMDGLKGVIPISCKTKSEEQQNLLGETTVTITECTGCKNDDIHKHNGTYCLVKDWNAPEPKRKRKFTDLLKQKKR